MCASTWPGRVPAACGYITSLAIMAPTGWCHMPCGRAALWSPPAPPALEFWLLVPLPRCHQERLLRTLGLLPPGIAFLAQVLYLVFSVMEQHHQQVALAFPARVFLGVQSFSLTVFSPSLRTQLRNAIQLGRINPELAVRLALRSNLAR